MKTTEITRREAVKLVIAGALCAATTPVMAWADDDADAVDTGASSPTTDNTTDAADADTDGTADDAATDDSSSSSSASSSKKKKKKKKKKQKPATRKQLLRTLSNLGGGKKFRAVNTTYKFNSAAGKRLKKAAAAVERVSEGGVLAFCMLDLTTGKGVSYNAQQVIYGASCMKGPYIASLNKYRPSTRAQAASSMYQVIVESNNEVYLDMRRRRFGSATMVPFLKYCKVHLGPSRTYPFMPARSLAKLWVGCYWYFYKNTNKNSKWCRNLYTHGNQSFIYQTFKGTYKVHTKPGWSPGFRGNVQNDAGIVMAGNKPYLLVVMSGAAGCFSQLRELCHALNAVHKEIA